jgi:hypothetical protein
MWRWPKPSEGSWTEHYPELGTEEVSFDDCVSPEFYDLEREAIFKRVWLNVGRVEQVPKFGSLKCSQNAVTWGNIVNRARCSPR